jgi:predicted CoA-substrate-specific enzyme activase
MRSAGIDVGSRTIKIVVVEAGCVVHSRVADTSYDPLAICSKLLDDIAFDTMVATGYGRHIFGEHYDCRVISEIKAFARGARCLFPECQAVLDIGGQDTKVISLDGNGRITRFEMNDKCAAGTGRFLEVMAAALRYELGDFGNAALQAQKAEKVSSMCTVFAESEVISLMTGGARREDIALGIHEAIGQRILSMLGRLPDFSSLVFAGGVAYNLCVASCLRKSLDIPLLVPPDPQIVGALGAAIEGLGDNRTGLVQSLCAGDSSR